MEDEIKFQDVKIPFGINKNFITKKDDNFIINSKFGGDFFPNKTKKIIETTAQISFGIYIILMFVILFLYNNERLSIEVVIYCILPFIFMGILFPSWYSLTSIKTQFIFSSNGIDINSQKGKIFIFKEDIDSVKISIDKKTHKGNDFYFYSIVLNFKKRIDIPYIYEKKYSAKILEEYNFYDGEDTRTKFILVSYIIQEIRKALELNYKRNKVYCAQ